MDRRTIAARLHALAHRRTAAERAEARIAARMRKGQHRAVIAGRLVITSAMQGQGAPIVDKATTYTDDGRYYRSRAILLKPWKRGERSIRARALVVGWLTGQQVSPDRSIK